MEKLIEKIVINNFDAKIKSLKPLGGGFYGKVFLAEINTTPYKLIFKLYLYKGIAEKEALQIKTLSMFSKAKMPEIFLIDTNNINDVLVMEYIEGINAGFQKNIPVQFKENLANEMVDNLILFHSHENLNGFGQLNDTVFESDWRNYYYTVAESVLLKAENLYKNNSMDESIYNIMKSSYLKYDKIFYLPINKASLIHGDYNTWNILLTEDMQNISGIIDPFNCCYADSEFDLYQLDNANGKDFGLLDLYIKKQNVSENFNIKRVFYELFTEVNHYYDAERDMKNSNINNLAIDMKKIISSI